MLAEPDGARAEPDGGPRRAVLVLARHGAGAAAPPGVDPQDLARAALADSYEVVADLVGVRSGIAGDADAADLLWPGALHLPGAPLAALAATMRAEVDELVVVPGDAPDLPGLVLAKVFKVLHRSDVVLAPERGGPGVVALGVRLPLASWLLPLDLDLDAADLRTRLTAAAPRRSAVQTAPDWHRLRTPGALARLDPGLEGWEETRELLRVAGALGVPR
ncbi:hypothetical protein SAMN04488543_2505 [Friedmanniella luteola]|uniref:MobA-like NTP transferase domain-containing protein n=1 Tax=Friedmanniella luteola TaxID=546871 RepID=A0A1H1VKJ5_9ACTN|nr:hypothetical protein [Friedmanniella luteola]SDS84786.1 hypothetical protein SAMN04488543_2505 [Friedmanniella luteola]